MKQIIDTLEIIAETPSLFDHAPIKAIIKECSGLCTHSKPWQSLADAIVIESLNWKQFEKYQSFHTKIEFMTGDQWLEITKSKRVLSLWLRLRNEAYDWYMNKYRNHKELGRVA